MQRSLWTFLEVSNSLCYHLVPLPNVLSSGLVMRSSALWFPVHPFLNLRSSGLAEPYPPSFLPSITMFHCLVTKKAFAYSLI